MGASEHCATVSYSCPEVVGEFYILGEVSETKFVRDGVAWTATYRAKKDAVGWLVYEVSFTAQLGHDLVEAIVLTMREIGHRKDDEIRHGEVFAATAGTPGVLHSFNSLKRRRSCVRTVEQMFTPMLEAMVASQRGMAPVIP